MAIYLFSDGLIAAIESKVIYIMFFFPSNFLLYQNIWLCHIQRYEFCQQIAILFLNEGLSAWCTHIQINAGGRAHAHTYTQTHLFICLIKESNNLIDSAHVDL